MIEPTIRVTEPLDTNFDKGVNLSVSPLLELLREAETNAGRVEVIKIDITAPAREYQRLAPFWVDRDFATEQTSQYSKQNFQQLKQSQAQLILAGFPCAQIVGQGALITNKGRIVRNSVLEFLAHNRTPDGLNKLASHEIFQIAAETSRHITVPCILAKRPWYSNYGHWLVDSLSVLVLNETRIREERLAIVIGAFPSAGMRALVLETISKIFPENQILEHPDNELWTCDMVYYQMPPHVPPLFKSPDAIERIRKLILGPISQTDTKKKLFVSRRFAGTRKLVNEVEIYNICAASGFEMVEPETLPFSEQAKLFSEASSIIGVKGAALANCMFCAPGTKLLALSPADFPDPFFWDLGSQIGVEYAEVFGKVTTNKPQGLNDFQLEPEQVRKLLIAADI